VADVDSIGMPRAKIADNVSVVMILFIFLFSPKIFQGLSASMATKNAMSVPKASNVDNI
jgi:hypothetical protein